MAQHIENIGNSRQVSIWLDSYDDMFSDFDPRPYPERTLSDDFIAELKKVSREDKFEIGDLHLLMPAKNRKSDNEQVITKRIHAYFRKGNYLQTHRMKVIRGKAVLLTLGGMALILLASYISGTGPEAFYMKILFVLFQPAGWFFVWTGMDDLFFVARKRKEELDFFSKMAKTKVAFASV